MFLIPVNIVARSGRGIANLLPTTHVLPILVDWEDVVPKSHSRTAGVLRNGETGGPKWVLLLEEMESREIGLAVGVVEPASLLTSIIGL